MAIDVEKLLADVSPDEPCGPDLSYDPDYLALFRDAEGTKSQSMGDAVIEGAEPNWREVAQSATELLARSKDLNVALLLTAASLAQRGLPGLAEGIKLVKGLCEKHWDHFHPQLDPDDGNDPLERMNLIAALNAPIGQDGDLFQFRRRLREAPLANSRQLGTFALRHHLMATGAISPGPDDQAPTSATIDGAFAASEPEEVLKVADAAQEAAEASKELDNWLTSKVGAGSMCDLKPWHDALKEVARLVDDQVAKLGLRTPTADDSNAEAAPSETQAASGAAPPAGVSVAIPGAINTREDVVKTLGKIMDYYQKAEPSSPVPILLHRARRLATMSFVDIIKDLSPDAMNQINVVGGVDAIKEITEAGNAATPASAPASPAQPPAEPPKPVRLT